MTRSARVLFQENRDGCLADAAFRDADHKVIERILVGVAFDAVHSEKNERGCDGGWFVAVNERVIPADAVEIRGSHREKRLVKKRAVECGFGAADRRLQQPNVANARRAAEESDLFRMETEHLVEPEEWRFHYSLSRLKRPAYLRLIFTAG